MIDPLPDVIRRVLGTGSRTWLDTRIIRDTLTVVWRPGAVLVTGACPDGADALMEQCWTHWGGLVERHPAAWTDSCRPECTPNHRRARRDGILYCPTAGLYRNQDMVDLGADVAVAFIRNHSPGASHCATAIRAAGIPLIPR